LADRVDGRVEWLLRADDAARPVPVSARMAMDDEYWRATIERFDPSDGLRIFLTAADVHREFVFDTHQTEPDSWLLSHVPVSGAVRLSFSDGVVTDIGPKLSALFQPAERRGVFTLSPQRDLRHVGYSVRADRVRQMFGDELPERLAGMIGDYGPTRLIETATSVRMRGLAVSLFAERLQGPLRLIYMEGVALQLLAIQAAELDAGARPTISTGDRRALEEARDRLTADMANPPNIGALAVSAGMSERALNAGFRSLFGGTVYEVLRDERLAVARLALETGEASIKQIAHRVGYSHVSNFTAAFTRRYGKPPLRYMRARAGDASPAE
jgi:AraC-like DNA-binding protein